MTEQKPKRGKRSYNSPRRQEQATNTRTRVIQAAIHELKEEGYADMNLEAIAARAGVAPQTVYGICGSKKGILEAIEQHFSENDACLDLSNPAWRTEKPGERAYALGRQTCAIIERRLPDYTLALTLSTVSHKYAHISRNMDEDLYQQCHAIVAHMQKEGLLRSDLDAESAAQAYWALASPDTQRRLVNIKGWSNERYRAWLTELLAIMLFDNNMHAQALEEWRTTA